MNTYIDKLCSQSEKLAQALGDSDESLTQTIIEDDSSLTDKAWSVFYNLKCLEDDIKENIEQRKIEINKPITPEETSVQKLCEFQLKLQQDFFSHQKEKSELQVKLQQELIDKQKLPPSSTAVNYPNWTLQPSMEISYSGWSLGILSKVQCIKMTSYRL